MNRFIAYLQRRFSGKRSDYCAFREILGFYPRNLSLYHLAFRHRSAVANIQGKESLTNERLEFLGDAVLGAVIAHVLFKKYPYRPEGFLTEMRSKLVSRVHLNSLGMKLGLDLFMPHNVDRSSKSLFGDTLEALLGAIYIDRGYQTVYDFINMKIIQNHVNLDEMEVMEVNFKGKLIDWAQKERNEVDFVVLDEPEKSTAGRYHVQVVVNKVNYGRGSDFSKKKAEQRAAEETCRMLGIDTESEK